MSQHISPRSDPYHGVFSLELLVNGQPQLAPRPGAPSVIPDPNGRLLKIATVEGRAHAICPACAKDGQGGFVSFVQDLRLAYACPSCQQFVWLSGA